QRLMYRLPALLLRSQRMPVLLQSVVAHFALQLPVALPARHIERAALERFPHSASRLIAVGAVCEPAQLPERGDVLERFIERLLAGPELQFPHSRVVDDRS